MKQDKKLKNQFPPIGSWKDLLTGGWAVAILKIIYKIAGAGDAIQFENWMIEEMESGLSEEEAFQRVKDWEKVSANYWS